MEALDTILIVPQVNMMPQIMMVDAIMMMGKKVHAIMKMGIKVHALAVVTTLPLRVLDLRVVGIGKSDER